jgi:DNA-binding transcriptional LysR family regulator
MKIEYLREFVVLSKYLNVTKAAAELYMTQSSLSKHIKQTEQEVGFPLIANHGNRLFLTPAGATFLSKIQTILRQYDLLLQECREVQTIKVTEIIAQRPVYQDISTAAYFSLLNTLNHDNNQIRVFFSKSSHKDFMHSLHGEEIHLFLDYHFGEPAEIIQRYAAAGLAARHLSCEKLGVWCPNADNADIGPMTIAQLSKIPVMIPADISSPIRDILTEIGDLHGFTPLFTVVPTTTQMEFIYSHQPDAVYVYPLSFLDEVLFKSHESMTVVPFADETICAQSFIVGKDSYKDEEVTQAVRKLMSAALPSIVQPG